MKKLLLFLLSFSFVLSVFAEKVIVVYKPNKEVAVIHPVLNGKMPTEKNYKYIYEKATCGTELEGLPYDIINIEDLPDRETRGGWEGEKGKGVMPNTVKAAKIKKEIKEKKLIKEREKKILKDQAIAELKAEGLIE